LISVVIDLIDYACDPILRLMPLIFVNSEVGLFAMHEEFTINY